MHVPVFELKPVSLPSGDFAAAWFDDEQRLWNDERLHKSQPILTTWRPPKLRLHRPGGSTAVLFNPNAYAVSEQIRSALSGLSGIEFLPIEVADHGTFFVLHVTTSYPAPLGCALRRVPPPKGNIVEVFSFPSEYSTQSDFFRILQPQDSAAGRAGYCVRAIFANADAASAVTLACGNYLAARELVHA